MGKQGSRFRPRSSGGTGLPACPEEPRCGFSRKASAMLKDAGVTFGTFDILSDEEVRQGLKEFSNWPTYPQLYGKGKLVGGLDIMQELLDAGELADALGA